MTEITKINLLKLQMMTANCKEVVSPDNQADNGIVHVVDGVLEPAEDTLSDMISTRPELSTLKTSE